MTSCHLEPQQQPQQQPLQQQQQQLSDDEEDQLPMPTMPTMHSSPHHHHSVINNNPSSSSLFTPESPSVFEMDLATVSPQSGNNSNNNNSNNNNSITTTTTYHCSSSSVPKVEENSSHWSCHNCLVLLKRQCCHKYSSWRSYSHSSLFSGNRVKKEVVEYNYLHLKCQRVLDVPFH